MPLLSTLKNQTLSKVVQPSKPTPRRNPHDRAWWVGGFLFGFMVGLALSLTYGWLLDPRPLPVTPADLRPSAKAIYIRLIALAYAHNHHLDQAQTRLAAVADPNINQTIIIITEAYINQERDIRDIAALVELAQALGKVSPLMSTYLTTPTATNTPTPTSTTTPTITPTPRPTNTPTRATPTMTATLALTSSTLIPLPYSSTVTATLSLTPSTLRPTITSTLLPTPYSFLPKVTPTRNLNAPLAVKHSKGVCDNLNTGLLRIYIHDTLGQGIPGIEIKVSWANGEDHLFTGFKPEIEPGYADFQMKLTETYQVEVVNMKTTPPIPEITLNNLPLCQNSLPAWQLVLQQGVK